MMMPVTNCKGEDWEQEAKEGRETLEEKEKEEEDKRE